MLGNLDNEVIFKKAFTNKIVFKAFVRDILGIEIEVDKIETEKRTQAKNKEAGKITIAKVENAKTLDIAKNAIKKGYENAVIADITGLSIEEINKLRQEE